MMKTWLPCGLAALLLTVAVGMLAIPPCWAMRGDLPDSRDKASIKIALGRPDTNKYSRSDLLVVMPVMKESMALVKATRVWRKGITTFILSDELPAEKELSVFRRRHKEVWATYTDVRDSSDNIFLYRPGDLRAAIAPFFANVSMGVDSFKFMLFGDDDTVFLMDNVLKLLNTLDHEHPAIISDSLWFPEDANGTKIHPNRQAPRCLPCNYKDALLDMGGCPGHSGWIAPKGCPCSRQLLAQTNQWGPPGEPKFNDGLGVWNPERDDFEIHHGNLDSPHAGWWYMAHGGAGQIISSSFFKQASFNAVEQYLNRVPPQSGDAMLTKVAWYVLGIAPTDPGYGFCRAHIQMFDPGFKGYRAQGPEDHGTADAGADPLGVIERLQWALKGSPACDEKCLDQLEHTITVHLRSRYAAQDLLPDIKVQLDKADILRISGRLITRLTKLAAQFAHRSEAAGGGGMGSTLVPLWDN